MILVRPKAILTLSATVLIAAASIAPSDARPARQAAPLQSESSNYDLDYKRTRDWDSSCFRSTGLPEQYACSSHGG